MKKNIFLLSLLILSLFYACTTDYSKFDIPNLENSLEEGVVAFYPFTNNQITDFAYNKLDLTNKSLVKPTKDRGNKEGNAFFFDANNRSFLSLSNNILIKRLNDFSISMWYQPLESNRQVNDFETLISLGDGLNCPDKNGRWSIGLFDCRKCVFGKENSVWDNTISTEGCQSEMEIRTNQWAHVVSTYNFTKDEMAIYRNGILQSKVSGQINCENKLNVINEEMFIGKNFHGNIDDIIIYDRILTPDEVIQLFESEPF